MTTQEAHEIMSYLQELEFPFSFHKARQIALLKAGAIPTMSKLFSVTGQNNRRNAGKRSIDTEILLREVQSQHPESERYMLAVARMNYLHSRYRKAGKILDNDLLHTLGSSVVEIFRVIQQDEWRQLTDVEKCAVGIFHKNLGEDMGIPYTKLPSFNSGWRDGLHFAMELVDWTIQHEKVAAIPMPTNDQYVRVYVDSATSKLPQFVTLSIRKYLGSELDSTMRTSLNLESPGPITSIIFASIQQIRKMWLRYLCLPRPKPLEVKMVEDKVNSVSGLYNFNHQRLQPWYVKPSIWKTWGPGSFLARAFGGKPPGSVGSERFHPEGYDLWTIGPSPQQGKGIDDMKSTVEFLKARGLDKCPFSHGGQKVI